MGPRRNRNNPIGRSLAYLRFRAAHRARSRSQFGQDLFVLHESSEKRDGYFVDFGAANGVDLSNTFLLEREYGWRGICAEPSRRWHAALHANRTCRIDERCVWSRTGETIRFTECEAGEFSTISSFTASDLHAAVRRRACEYEVRTVSLTEMLESHGAPREIDYLSIDTEGSELDILEAHDFGKFVFRLVTVEHNFHPARRNAIARLLKSKGYRRVMPVLSLVDDWYVLRG